MRSPWLGLPYRRCAVLPIGRTVLRWTLRRCAVLPIGRTVLRRALVRRVRGALLLRMLRPIRQRALRRCVLLRRVRRCLLRSVSSRVLRRGRAVPSERRGSWRCSRSGWRRLWRIRFAGRNDRGTVAGDGGAQWRFGLGCRGRWLDGQRLRRRVSRRRFDRDAGDRRFILRTPCVVIGQ
jgi:hypothetical protein